MTLAPVVPEETRELHQLWIMPEVRQFLWDDEVIPICQTKEIIKASQQQFQSEKSGLWLMRSNQNQELIGFCGLWYFFDEPQAQLLFGLDPGYFGYGYATEGANCLVDYAFNQLRYHYLIASCDTPHTASIKVMERLGMIKESESFRNELPTAFYKLDNKYF